MNMEVDRHNEISLWREVIDRLGVAGHELEQVGGLLEDIAMSGQVPPWDAELFRLGAAILRLRGGAATIVRELEAR